MVDRTDWHHTMYLRRGVTSVKRKAVRVTARVGDRLTRFLFDRNEPPESQDMTIVITGVAEENLYNADIFVGGHDGGTVISADALHKDIKTLLVGVLGGERAPEGLFLQRTAWIKVEPLLL